jgi:hypothetical protein
MAFETRGVPHDQTLFLCIQQSRTIVLHCAACANEHTLTPDQVLAGFGDDLDVTLEELAARTECGHCHSLLGVVSLQPA